MRTIITFFAWLGIACALGPIVGRIISKLGERE